jgi:biopolymer transport protein ExbD
MAQALGTNTKGSVNIDLNIVPFIDLMSCLTAFLLVAAVWVNIAQLTNHAAGRGRENPCLDDPDRCEQPKLSVLLEGDDIWVGVSRVGDFQKIPKVDGKYDWTALEAALKVHKGSAFFTDKDDIEVAAASSNTAPIAYDSLVAAMDVAVKSGFVQVGVVEPHSLSASPQL